MFPKLIRKAAIKTWLRYRLAINNPEDFSLKAVEFLKAVTRPIKVDGISLSLSSFVRTEID